MHFNIFSFLYAIRNVLYIWFNNSFVLSLVFLVHLSHPQRKKSRLERRFYYYSLLNDMSTVLPKLRIGRLYHRENDSFFLSGREGK